MNALDGSPVEDVDWQSELLAFTRRRGKKPSAQFVGEVVNHDTEERLVLSRDRGTAPRQRHRGTGAKSALAMASNNHDPVEEAFVTFLPSKNVFCLSRTSIAAPPPRSVAEWLTVMKVPIGLTWKAEPLIDPDRFDRVKNVESALWVDIVATPPPAIDDRGGLFRGLASLADVGQHTKIEIKVSTTRGNEAAQTRRRLWVEAQRMRDDLAADGGVIQRATVKVPGQAQPIDLVKDQIVLQATTDLTLGATDRSLSETVVFHVHDAQIAAHADRINKSLGAL